MATPGELMPLVKGALQDSREQLYQAMEETDQYRQILNSLSVAITDLTTGLHKQAQLRTRRRLVVWSIAITVTVIAVLVILSASRMESGFAHDLLETIGGALITFSLVEVVLHWMIEIPTKAVREQEKLVSKAISTNESAADRVAQLEADTKPRRAVIDRLNEQLDAIVQSLAP